MRRTDRDPSSSRGQGRNRRRTATLSLALVALVLGIVSAALPASAQTETTYGPEFAQADLAQDELAQNEIVAFDVIQVSGFLDPIVADFIDNSLTTAEENGSGGVVLQINSSRTVISDEELTELAERVHGAAVPVYAWVGPSGSTAQGGAAQLAAVTDGFSVSVGSSFGKTGPLLFPELMSDEFLAVAPGLEDATIDEEGIVELGLVPEGEDSPTIGFFMFRLPGFESDIEVGEDGEPTRIPVTPVRFTKLSFLKGWLHSFASPAMAYLLFLIGGGLLIFEFYTAGVGIAGVLGAVTLILGCYGLAVLPTNSWAIALLVLSFFGFAVDVQTGVPRAWSVIASVALILGSLFLYDGFSLSWITLIAGIGGMMLSMISGMPAMVRTRFGTPTIGREWMVDSMGTAAEDIKKEGVVLIDGAPWKARVNRATPIAKGDPVRVVGIEGLYLEIEPEEGGARDYREMRGAST